METFEFVVTSIARVALEDTAEYKLNSKESLWTSEY